MRWPNIWPDGKRPLLPQTKARVGRPNTLIGRTHRLRHRSVQPKERLLQTAGSICSRTLLRTLDQSVSATNEAQAEGVGSTRRHTHRGNSSLKRLPSYLAGITAVPSREPGH